MRKLKLQMHVSIDGYVAGPNGELDWIHTSAGPQPVIDLAATCDTLLIGRKLGQGFIDTWEDTYNNAPGSPWHPLAEKIVQMRKIVFSRTQTAISGTNAEITNAGLATTVQALKSRPGKDILVYGGANFVSSLIDLDLIDEYHLFIKPVALGSGMKIFHARKRLALQRSVVHEGVVVINTFVPAGEPS